MRGTDQQQNHVFSYLSPEARVRRDHPLRAIRALVDVVLTQLSPRFDSMYAALGRPSIPPEKLLRAQLLQMLYSIRSERLLMEEMDYNLLFRWFVGLNADDKVWDATTFTKNRDRLLQADVAKEFLAQVVAQAGGQGLTSDEHFTVDGTLLEAWAGAKSFQAREGKSDTPPDDPGNPTVDFHGERRANETHESKTDPEAQLARKGPGKESKLSYTGNLLVENRNGLIVAAEVFQANGTAERDAALVMLEKLPGTQPVAGVRRAHGIADQLLRPLDPVQPGLGHHQYQVSRQLVLLFLFAKQASFPFPRRRLRRDIGMPGSLKLSELLLHYPFG